MKKNLLNQRILPSLGLMLLCSNLSFGQQTIGEFPVMDGGFETQTISSMGKNIADPVEWTISTNTAPTKSIITNAASARSGSKYASFSNGTTGSARLQTPIASTLATGTKYTVQYYFKAGTSPLAYLTGAIYSNGNSTNAPIITKPTIGLFVVDTWIKAYATFTSNVTAGTGTAVFASPRINGTTNTTDIINIDDFVVYAGDIDETAPNAPSAVTVNGLDVSWTAAAGGVDGGGYVVVRYASQPASDNNPNQNGIYKVGNIFTSGTNLLPGTIVYIGNGATTSITDGVVGSNSGQDFYKVYAVDKAFNYSPSGTVTALGTNQWSLNNQISIYPNPVKNSQITISLPASISGKVAVRIYNIGGQLVYKTDVVDAVNSIEVLPNRSLTAGVYVVKVENNGNTSIQKITVK
ncbi:T9SS type A sorting domain-containing protein [Flavobacterium sp. WC2509]|uniref:T9SS type A sorting domain-containing protein n=1 Tax=Flavobacterium sp. WC2509 TaxID=3461406 RepID=UPI00404511D2